MQIHEITEGILRNIGRGFVQGVTGVDLDKTPPAAAPDAPNSGTRPQAIERIVVAVSQPGQSVPSKYYKTNNAWTNELGTAIADPKQTAYLDKLIPTHGKKETIEPPSVPRRVSRRRAPQ